MIEFSQSSLHLLNVLIACMMFGVSLSLHPGDFTRIVRRPVAPVTGLVAQFVLLPAGTCLLAWVLQVRAELALGMILVAACPGGNFSNILTWLSRGNVAVSVSMTAVSSLAATVLTPLNFALYSWLNPITRDYLTEISVDPISILVLVALVLGLPITLGMLAGARFRRLAAMVERPLRVISIVLFLAFVAVAFAKNFDLFLDNFNTFFWLVVAHNAVALLLGFLAATALRLPVSDRRAVTLEVGIQNSALGLVIAFNFFPDLGGALLIIAFWGVWHLVAGLIVSRLFARRSLPTTDPMRVTRIEESLP